MAVLGQNDKKKTYINPLKKAVMANNGVNEMTKTLRKTIQNACTFNINFIWGYVLNIYNCEDSYGLENLINLVAKISEATSEMKSIAQIYQYMVQNKNDLFSGLYNTIEDLKESMPMYSEYLESTVLSENEQKIEDIKEDIVKDKLNPNYTINVEELKKDNKNE